MAVTKTITKAIPYERSNKVEKWQLEMTYENDSEGDATYYTSNFNISVIAADGDFTAKAKGNWTNAQLVAICPVSSWDAVFASQVDSVITNPPAENTPDNDFNIPS